MHLIKYSLIFNLFFLVFYTNAFAQRVGVDIRMDINRLGDQFDSWLSRGIDRFDRRANHEIRESGIGLVKTLVELAGKKSALSAFLDSEAIYHPQFKRMYEIKIAELNVVLDEVTQRMERIDPEWAVNEPRTFYELFRSTERKREALRESKILSMPSITISSIENDQIDEISKDYQTEALLILELSERIANSLRNSFSNSVINRPIGPNSNQ